MTRLNAANNAVSKLASGINSVATILTVEDGSLFPEPPFLITIEDEIIQVGDKNGNAFSDLLRGAEGTTPAAHNAGVNVDNRFTAGTYDALATTEDLSTHTNDANNPHNVTAAQTGAETPSGAQAKVDTHEQKAAPHSGHETPAGVQAKVDAHAELTNNPHQVTAAQVGAETPTGAQEKVDAKAIPFTFDSLAALPGYYKTTEFDTPGAGDITESIKLSVDDSVFATRLTEFDTPAAGDITVTIVCTALGINNKVVTEFDVPAAGDITETASEVV